MPLEHSSSPAALKRNIGTLMREVGKSPHVGSRAQAIAIGYATQRRAAHRAFGGGLDTPFDPMQGSMAGMMQQGMPNNGVGAAPTMPLAPGAMPSVGIAGAIPQPPSVLPPPSQLPQQPMPQGQPQNTSVGVAPPPAGTPTTPNNPMSRPLMANGGALNRASGGMNMMRGPHLDTSWQTRNEARQLMHGPILSAVPGRTDNHQARVPANSYVLPAAHLAAMGRGNSVAGLSIANQMFGGPWGTSPMKMGHGHPRFGRASGGHVGEDKDFPSVACNLAGGEYVIHPRAIIQKFGSIKRGHKILDHWIMSLRDKEIKTLKNLPKPAKS